ncbi:sigma-70 family RNA polymerase sigma factor [Nesterenkonia sp. NBAIMH1]|uniref:sigma-70 family RNA polymerase sigma factor n=1 Tax=Nesterenkonia sp. NBAIMH1 TaxID=2600320 RepID=UPI00143D64C2
MGYLVSDLCSRATHLSREDLTSVGSIALIQAADAFDPEKGVPFGAYARRRILGAFADEMRSSDWAGRLQRQKIRQSRSAEDALTGALGRRPSVAEVAAAMGVDEKTAGAAMRDAQLTEVSLEDEMSDYLVAESSTPEQELLAAEQAHVTREAVQALPERMRLIVTRLFFDGSTVKDVAAELGVTHSAVSQQRTEAMRMLRTALNAHYAMGTPEPAAAKGAGAKRREQYSAMYGQRVLGGLLALIA